jgi:hypothetical protein
MPKVYEYATLDSVIDALNQGESIALEDIRPSLRGATVHVGYHGMGGGYMPDYGSHFYARNRRAIVDAHCETVCRFDESNRAPNGFRRSLMAGISARSRDGRTCFEVDVLSVSDAIR